MRSARAAGSPRTRAILPKAGDRYRGGCARAWRRRASGAAGLPLARRHETKDAATQHPSGGERDQRHGGMLDQHHGIRHHDTPAIRSPW